MSETLRAIVVNTIEQHKRIFEQELSLPEVAHVVQSILEHKRKLWLGARLGDFKEEELMELMKVVEGLDDERLEALDEPVKKEG